MLAIGENGQRAGESARKGGRDGEQAAFSCGHYGIDSWKAVMLLGLHGHGSLKSFLSQCLSPISDTPISDTVPVPYFEDKQQ